MIHGRDFKPAAATYLELAVTAMRAGLERDFPDCVECFDQLSIDLAWYGDLNADVLQRKGKTYDESLDVGDRRNALRALREITPRKRFGIRLYDKLPGKSALPEFFMDVSAPLLGAVGFRMPVLARLRKTSRRTWTNSSSQRRRAGACAKSYARSWIAATRSCS